MDVTANPNEKQAKSMRNFARISFWEGISFLILVFLAMPLKYLADLPEFVRGFGMLHGVLFLLYAFQLAYLASMRLWSFKIVVLYFLASFLPFAPFWVEKKVLKDLEARS